VVLWVVTPCSPVGRCWHFTATCAFIFRAKVCRVRNWLVYVSGFARKVASKTGFAAYTLPPWWWGQQFLWNISICEHPRRLPSQQSPSWKPLQRIPFLMCAVIYLHVLIHSMSEQFVREIFCLSICLTFLKGTTVINDSGMWIQFYQLLVKNVSNIHSFIKVKFFKWDWCWLIGYSKFMTHSVHHIVHSATELVLFLMQWGFTKIIYPHEH
jgi:hypothetical protein